MPTLEKIFRQDPESIPFRQPVDPQTLGIPDYFEIVKRPMDLSTIKRKLDIGQYADPWEYVDDVWLMFDNAWLYNRKTSRVYRYCTKVSKYCIQASKQYYLLLLHIINVFFFKFIISWRKSSSRKSIQLCKVWAIVAAESTLSILRCYAVSANNSALFPEMRNITVIKIGMYIVEYLVFHLAHSSSFHLTNHLKPYLLLYNT